MITTEVPMVITLRKGNRDLMMTTLHESDFMRDSMMDPHTPNAGIYAFPHRTINPDTLSEGMFLMTEYNDLRNRDPQKKYGFFKGQMLSSLEGKLPDFNNIETLVNFIKLIKEEHPTIVEIGSSVITSSGRGYIITFNEGHVFGRKYVVHVTEKSGKLVYINLAGGASFETEPPVLSSRRYAISIEYPIVLSSGYVDKFDRKPAVIEDEIFPYIKEYSFAGELDLIGSFYRYHILIDDSLSVENAIETINWCSEQNEYERTRIIRACKEYRLLPEQVQEVMSTISVFSTRKVVV